MANILKNIPLSQDSVMLKINQTIQTIEEPESKSATLRRVDNPSPPPTFRGLSAESMDIATPRDVGRAEHNLNGQQTPEEIYQSGYAQGVVDGQQQKQAELQEQLTSLQALLLSIPNAIQENRQQLSEEIADIVLVIVQKLFIHQQHDKNIVTQQIQHILSQLNNKQNLEIVLHPQDLALLKNGEIQLDIPLCKPLSFIPDETLRLGGCIIRSPHGVFDASIERQIDNLKQVLLEIRSAFPK